MKKTGFFRMVGRCVGLTVRSSAKHFFAYILLMLIMTVIDVGQVIVNTSLFNAVEQVSMGTVWTAALIPLVIQGVLVVATRLLGFAEGYAGRIFELSARGMLQLPLNEACGRLETVAFEDSATLDRIGKATAGMNACVGFVSNLIMIFTACVPYITILAVYLYSLRPLLLWSVLIIFVPFLLTQFLRAAMFRNFENQVAPTRRENDYYDRCISHRDYFKETRLLGAYSYFAKRFRASLRAFYRASSRAEVRSGLFELAAHILTLAGYVGVLVLLFDSVMGKYITVGAFAAVFASIANFIWYMEDFFESGVGMAAKNYGAVKNYIDFVFAPSEKKKSARIEARGAITLEDVRFAYPGAARETIRGISLTIRPGETLAVVGENGAGKSTLMRLITGQYLATGGRVTAGGFDLSELDRPSRFRGVSAVFQRFGRYRMTARENIEISSEKEDGAAFNRAARDADVGLDDGRSFPDGADTLLSREFGGVDLSGGQWQRVAIARGLYRAHDLIILDEPTAAIDPIEETRLYQRFSEISEGRTAIIVTHRLGSARIADRIVVMKDGLVDDVGTHDELVARGGHYANLYESQAAWYVH